MLARTLIRISENLPELPLDSSAATYVKKLPSTSATPGQYVSLAFLLGAAGGMTGFVFFPRIEIFLLAFAFFFFLFLQLPKMEFRRYVGEMERDLPFALRDLGILLGMRIPFGRGLEAAGEGEGALAGEFRTISKELEEGVAFSKILAQRSRFLESPEMARAFAQLISAYEEGASGKEIRRLGDELLAQRGHRLREYANRSAIIGLLFLVATAIAPTFFLVMTGITGSLGETRLDSSAISLTTMVFFPLLAGTILLLGKALAPDPVFSRATTPSLLPFLLAVPLAFLATTVQGAALYFLLLAMATGIILLQYPAHLKQKRQEEIERILPDALLMAAALPRGSTIHRIFELWAHSRYGALSEEAEITLRQLQANLKPEQVLVDFEDRNPSPTLHRALHLLRQAFSTNHLERLHEIAEDMLKHEEILRQRQALMGIQKYTLLLGAALVPLILKNATRLLEDMAVWAGTEQAVSPSSSLLPMYVVLYALLGSYYLADMENTPSQSLLYFGGMGIVGLGILAVA